MHQEMLARMTKDMQSSGATQAEIDEMMIELESLYQQGLRNIRQDYQQDNRILKVNDDIVINLDDAIKGQAIRELREEGVELPNVSDFFISNPTVYTYLYVGAMVIGVYIFVQIILPYVLKCLNL